MDHTDLITTFGKLFKSYLNENLFAKGGDKNDCP